MVAGGREEPGAAPPPGVAGGRAAVPAEQARRIRAEIARVAPLLAGADRHAQMRLLDEAFERADYDPDWRTWRVWAREVLPAYRPRPD